MIRHLYCLCFLANGPRRPSALIYHLIYVLVSTNIHKALVHSDTPPVPVKLIRSLLLQTSERIPSEQSSHLLAPRDVGC